MLFVPVLIIAIYFFLTLKRIAATVIFFFFLCNGFQVVPLSLFDMGIGIDKPQDFSLLFTLFFLVYGLFKYSDFIPNNYVTKTMVAFLGFVLIGCLINRYVYHVPLLQIVRTVRFFFIFPIYFVFRRLTQEEVSKVQCILFYIVLIQCCLFILQVITGEVILTGSAGGSLMKDVGFRRFYNLPSLIYYFVFYAIFNNPFESKNKKKLSIVIIVITLMLPLHRVLLTSFWLLVFWGIFLWSGGLKGSIKYIFIVVLCLLPFVNILLTRFEKNTQSDVNQIIIGDFAEYVEVGTDMEMVENATMLFRIAHFYERFMYVIEDKRYIVFGAGYMSEDSALADALDFNIGLMDYESRVLQVDSPDISWSSLVLRFGIVGTLVYLCFFTALIVFCWKKRKWKLGMCSFLYLMLVFFTSISSSEFYHAWLYIIVLLNIRDSAIAEVEEQNEDNGQNTLQKVII